MVALQYVSVIQNNFHIYTLTLSLSLSLSPTHTHTHTLTHTRLHTHTYTHLPCRLLHTYGFFPVQFIHTSIRTVVFIMSIFTHNMHTMWQKKDASANQEVKSAPTAVYPEGPCGVLNFPLYVFLNYLPYHWLISSPSVTQLTCFTACRQVGSLVTVGREIKPINQYTETCIIIPIIMM